MPRGRTGPPNHSPAFPGPFKCQRGGGASPALHAPSISSARSWAGEDAINKFSGNISCLWGHMPRPRPRSLTAVRFQGVNQGRRPRSRRGQQVTRRKRQLPYDPRQGPGKATGSSGGGRGGFMESWAWWWGTHKHRTPKNTAGQERGSKAHPRRWSPTQSPPDLCRRFCAKSKRV